MVNISIKEICSVLLDMFSFSEKVFLYHNIGYYLANQLKLVIASLSLFITLSFVSGNATANQILFNTGGVLNGQNVDAAGTTITVNLGELISV